MTHDDPTDELLRRAFAADQAYLESPDVVGNVMRRIRRRARLRMLILGSMALACIAILTVSDLTLSSGLTTWGRELTALLHSDSVLTVSLVLLLLTAFAAVEAELT